MQLLTLTKQKGFTLIEALVAFFVLSVGLLGAIALQAKAKQASFDSMQRAAAVALGNDIIQRIRANDVATSDVLYDMTFTSTEALISNVTCQNSVCDAEQISLYDKLQWQQAVRARENSGTLDNAQVCINTTRVNGAITSQINLRVVVTWEGKQALNGDSLAGVDCGDSSTSRRAVTLTSSVHLRAP